MIVMSEKLKWIMRRPWVAHVASFVVMVGVACPRYRVPSGTSIGLVKYGMDSIILAFQLPAAFFHLLFHERVPPLVTISVVWALALWPLLFSIRRWGLVLSYLTLIPLWLSYLFGWWLTQSWTGH
jgi:hypothetical protein